jgi:rhodanese-related sulfurtransferase
MLKTIADLVAEARQNLRCLDAGAALVECREAGGTILDVREPVEVNDLPALHSLNVPRGILEMKIVELIPDADHPLYLHCASGGRATMAAEQLQRLGYTRVTVIAAPIGEVIAEQSRQGG